eukprot:TRINITY_DN6718_c0_g1_i2.p1 TRINITY_DN6718_c0_g1~~TRINITY_DN6718_c0_g1_i2.p1  ORF type:complete len:122 (+),score=64.73 TRINITY_DN6718_c0_g1_i2:116-481(+)
MVFFFFFKQKTAYEMLRSLVGSEMCIRDRYCNMFEAGIIDPMKVVKSCVINSCSVAGLMITTEAAVVEKDLLYSGSGREEDRGLPDKDKIETMQLAKQRQRDAQAPNPKLQPPRKNPGMVQ